MDRTDLQELPDYEQRMAAARARAHYELGDSSWAELIVAAFIDPDRDMADLAAELGD